MKTRLVWIGVVGLFLTCLLATSGDAAIDTETIIT